MEMSQPALFLFYQAYSDRSPIHHLPSDELVDASLGDVLALATEGQTVSRPIDVIKRPYVLAFLDLPEQAQLRESDLEAAIIENLQLFLLELGKGFAFVARQYRVAPPSRSIISLIWFSTTTC